MLKIKRLLQRPAAQKSINMKDFQKQEVWKKKSQRRQAICLAR